jgi:hypothetical protein
MKEYPFPSPTCIGKAEYSSHRHMAAGQRRSGLLYALAVGVERARLKRAETREICALWASMLVSFAPISRRPSEVIGSVNLITNCSFSLKIDTSGGSSWCRKCLTPHFHNIDLSHLVGIAPRIGHLNVCGLNLTEGFGVQSQPEYARVAAALSSSL